MKFVPFFLIFSIFITGCKNKSRNGIKRITPAVSDSTKPSARKGIDIKPISHASMQLTFNGQTIYIDPVGKSIDFAKMKSANIILLTHGHPDHFNLETLQEISSDSTQIISPESVANLLPENLREKTKILKNNDFLEIEGINIHAVPMYNLREEAQSFHPKGDGNGYVLDNSQKRIYIAGDTGPIPEMRNLKSIDIAFIPMNLPYTMSVADAADAVLDFKPKKVYPYHYRGKNGFSDVGLFKNMINTNDSEIEVIQLDWYPKE
ncbi:MAG TPA: MBL fold metallo-hydrolase [Flavobacteriaceae bacterium]|nr:MBL fold metallo-hydrolase [Flavobacteriaceae bacterium]